MTDALTTAILRTLTWAETLGYAPTRAELVLTLDIDPSVPSAPIDPSAVMTAMDHLLQNGVLVERRGRWYFSDSAETIASAIDARDSLQPRKRRRALRVTQWLSWLPGVRFVALANTTALGNARDEGDLDFFVVVRAGSIWTTRLFGALPFHLLRMTPRPGCERDAVCLSYFIADDALDLSSHQLAGDDPYYRHWFLSLLPLFDDGVADALWRSNAMLRSRFPLARQWVIAPDLRVHTCWRLPTFLFRWFEPIARRIQMKKFPASIRERMNRDTTVLVTDSVLKFHTTDGRQAYRTDFDARCRRRGLSL